MMFESDPGADSGLSVEGVSAGYSPRATILHSVNLFVGTGQTLGVVGESGSGKSTLARVLVGQILPSEGEIRLDGRALGDLSRRQRRTLQRRIQLIPQDPYASLNPRMIIGDAIAEAIAPTGRPPADVTLRVARLLTAVGLDPEVARRYPHEFSGGQRQRVAIARALATEPDVIVADEVTSALDASVQAEVLNYLRNLQRSTGVAMVFITHDLSVAHYMCDTVAVLYRGRVVEHGSADLFFEPTHPYTELLLDSVPRVRGGEPKHAVARRMKSDETLSGDGCPFHSRCHRGPLVDPTRMECRTDLPAPVIVACDEPNTAVRKVACHFPIGTPPLSKDRMRPGADLRTIETGEGTG